MTTTRYTHQKDDQVHPVPREKLHGALVMARAIAATLEVAPTDVKSLSVFPGHIVIETFVRDEQGNRLLFNDEPLTSYSLYKADAA